MASLNCIILLGNITRDPELRYAPNGNAVCDMAIAMNRKWKTSEGEQKEDVCFIDVVVWGKQAEACAKYLRKGSQCLIEGRLQFEQWEKDGQKKSRHRVVAEKVVFVGYRKDGDGAGTQDHPKDRPQDHPNEPSKPRAGPVEEPPDENDDIPF